MPKVFEFVVFRLIAARADCEFVPRGDVPLVVRIAVLVPVRLVVVPRAISAAIFREVVARTDWLTDAFRDAVVVVAERETMLL